MPDKKISELVNLTSLATDDEFVVVDKGANATKRITATNLSKFPSGVTVPDAGTIGSASDPDAMAISSGGVVTFSQDVIVSGGVFLGGTAAANELDDYETGTWTPQFGAYGGTPTVRSSYYTKIGDIVIASGGLVGDGTADGSTIRIEGLPFASLNSTDRIFGGIISYSNGSETNLTLRADTNSSTYRAYRLDGTEPTYNSWGVSAEINFTLVYMVN